VFPGLLDFVLLPSEENPYEMCWQCVVSFPGEFMSMFVTLRGRSSFSFFFFPLALSIRQYWSHDYNLELLARKRDSISPSLLSPRDVQFLPHMAQLASRKRKKGGKKENRIEEKEKRNRKGRAKKKKKLKREICPSSFFLFLSSRPTCLQSREYFLKLFLYLFCSCHDIN
jgi:hypothetical protein